MKYLNILVCFLCGLALLGAGCRANLTSSAYHNSKHAAFILEEALLDCFPEGTAFEDGEAYNCEFSAVAPWPHGLIFGNDKNTPAVSPMVIHQGERLRQGTARIPATLPNLPFYSIRKIEDFAYSLDGRHLFISSGFDRLKDGDHSWDTYNQLLAWDLQENEVQVIAAEEHGGIVSSKSIRKALLSLLESQHTKVEGLMMLPGHRIVLGVREMGEHFERPIYTTTLVENHYTIKNGQILLDGAWTIRYQLDTREARENLGLSSLYYDKEKEMIYITSSFETGMEGQQTLGGYIWHLPLADYETGKKARLIRKANGQPLAFRHKVEGITKMDDGSYFIIYDNDRTDVPVVLPDGQTVSRKSYQAVYSIIQLP